MLPCPQFRDSVLFPFRCILVFGGKRRKKKLFLTLSSVWEQNLLGCLGLCFLNPYLSADRAVPAHNCPAHRWHVGHEWAQLPSDPGGPRGVPAPAGAPIPSWFPSAELWAETADRPGPEPWPSQVAVPRRLSCLQAAHQRPGSRVPRLPVSLLTPDPSELLSPFT